MAPAAEVGKGGRKAGEEEEQEEEKAEEGRQGEEEEELKEEEQAEDEQKKEDGTKSVRRVKGWPKGRSSHMVTEMRGTQTGAPWYGVRCHNRGK